MRRAAQTLLAHLRRLVGHRLHSMLRSSSILDNPFLSAKIIPLGRRETSDHMRIVVGQSIPAPTADGDGLPVPPPELREGWGTDASYLNTGRRDMETMLTLIEQADEPLPRLRRVLDFGCAAGRMLRFYPRPHDNECWGVDIKAKHILWCQQHLSPPFFFSATTTMPHLPFEDRYFDLVYCSSVFTHIGDLPDATLLELRRILRPNGLIYATVHDERSVDALFRDFEERDLTQQLRRIDGETGVLQERYEFFYIGGEPWTQVFYDSGYLVRKWSQFMEVASVTPEAMDYQTALLLRKRPDRLGT
jgi:SAM-dependent methyltransferase